MPDRHHLSVLIANEREDRIALVTTLVAGLGHDVIAGSTQRRRSRRADVERASRRRTRRARHQLDARAGADRAHRARGRVSRDRGARGPRPRLRRRGRQARRVRLHRGRVARGVAERARHHAAALRRVPQPARCVRATRADRARKGDPHGALPGRRAAGFRDAARPRAPQRTEARPRRPGGARRAPAAAARARDARSWLGSDECRIARRRHAGERPYGVR